MSRRPGESRDPWTPRSSAGPGGGSPIIPSTIRPGGLPVRLWPYALAGAYASLAGENGIALYGSGESLRSLASIIRVGAPAHVDLPAPPEDAVEIAPLRTIRLLRSDREPVNLRVTGKVIEIAGGVGALSKLAASLENLADTPEFGGQVPRHIDVEYFPGHGFLGEGSTWMTVTLLPVSSI